MKKIIIITTLIITSAILAQKGKDSGDWSPYQGHMFWNDANDKCKSLGMRLPTFDELKMARASGIGKSWYEKNGEWYWTSMAGNADAMYTFSIYFGSTSSQYKPNRHHVRCIQ